MAKQPEPLPADAVFVTPGEVRPLMVARQEVEKIFVGLRPQTLANAATEGTGPAFHRRGKVWWYKVEDVMNWLTSNPVQTNTEGKS